MDLHKIRCKVLYCIILATAYLVDVSFHTVGIAAPHLLMTVQFAYGLEKEEREAANTYSPTSRRCVLTYTGNLYTALAN